MGTQLPQKGGTPLNFRPMSVMAKRMDGSRCHLVQRYAFAQANVVLDEGPVPPKRGHSPPIGFRPIFIVAKRLDGSVVTWYDDRPRPKP